MRPLLVSGEIENGYCMSDKLKRENMKTKIFFFLFVVTLISFVIVLTMCKKRENVTSTQQPAKHELSQRDKKVLSLVEHFKANLNSKLKDGEEISIDSSIWYIESMLNVYYARFDSSSLIFTDSTFVTIPLRSNNVVRMSDVNVACLALIDSLTVHYQKIQFNEKNVLLADISVTQVHNDYIIVKMVDVMGTNSYWTPCPTFGTTDYWFWSGGEGKCDNFGGQFIGTDASDKLYQYANQWIIERFPLGCYTEVETIGPILPSDPNAQTTYNPCGFETSLLFGDGSSTIPEPNECLSPDCMNYYLNGLLQLGETLKPGSKVIISYYCHWDVNNCLLPCWGHIHFAKFTYGYYLAVPFPPIILED